MWPDRRRRRLTLLALGAALLGMGAAGPVQAQDAGATGESLFGTYQLQARGVGVQTRYEVVGILPGGAPVLDVGVPETTARFGSGPSGYGLAGLAYPGPLLGDLGPLISQSGFGEEDSIPPWPIKAEAFYPTGPTEVDESQGPAVQKVVTGDLGVLSQGVFPGVDGGPVVQVGSVTAASRTAIEDGAAVSRTRVAVADVNILGGLITIDSLVTDLVAAHNGEAGSTNGGTIASGVRFLGLAATLTGDGLVLEAAPGPSDPTGGALGPLLGPLQELTGPVQDLLADVLEQAVPQVNDLLAQAGLTITIASPVAEQAASGAAVRHSSGLTIDFSYLGKEQDALRQLLDSIPPDLTPPLGPIPFPTAFLVENHVGALSVGPGSVSALATPPFPPFEAPAIGPVAPSASGVPDLGSPGFSTPAAAIPSGPTTAPDSTGGTPTEPIASSLAHAVPALLVALVLLAAPLLGAGSSRLADNVLAPAAAGCPHGQDQPPPTRSPDP